MAAPCCGLRTSPLQYCHVLFPLLWGSPISFPDTLPLCCCCYCGGGGGVVAVAEILWALHTSSHSRAETRVWVPASGLSLGDCRTKDEDGRESAWQLCFSLICEATACGDRLGCVP